MAMTVCLLRRDGEEQKGKYREGLANLSNFVDELHP